MTVSVVIPAGGSGSRIGGRPKQYRLLGDRPILVQTLIRFRDWRSDAELVVAVPKDDIADVSSMLAREAIHARIVAGGTTRQESVFAGLRALGSAAGIVHVHDAVRPFADVALIERVHQAACDSGGAAPAVPVADTLRTARAGWFGDTVPRDGLFRMQTPQAFRLESLLHAHELAATDGFNATDDVELYARYVGRVACVEGSEANLKITSAADLDLAAQRWNASCA